jgi:cation transport regulator ChaB
VHRERDGVDVECEHLARDELGDRAERCDTGKRRGDSERCTHAHRTAASS